MEDENKGVAPQEEPICRLHEHTRYQAREAAEG